MRRPTNCPYSNATPILFPLIQTVRQLRITRSLSVINWNRSGIYDGLGTSIAAPLMEMFRTRQLVLDPSTEIKAASSISARGCLRLSSIYLLVHDWSQSKVKPICAGAMKTRPTGVVERALAWAGRGARRMHRASDVSPDLVARKWGNYRPATKKPPRRGSSEAVAKVLIERISGARQTAPHSDAITGFDLSKIWNWPV
jgi:hypothetical protein